MFIKTLCEELGIRTQIIWSRDCKARGTPTERLVNICREIGANVYLSGPSAKSYIDEAEFIKSSVGLEWMDYSSYARYSQLHGPFAHGVTILDLILNEGPDARTFLQSGAPGSLVSQRNSSPVRARDREVDPHPAVISSQATNRE